MEHCIPASGSEDKNDKHLRCLSFFRVSKNPPNVKTKILTVSGFEFIGNRKKQAVSLQEIPANPCIARHFDLLRNSPSTVSAYADEGELLVLTDSLTSASLPKKLVF